MKVLIYLHYEYYPTVTEWGQYPTETGRERDLPGTLERAMARAETEKRTAMACLSPSTGIYTVHTADMASSALESAKVEQGHGFVSNLLLVLCCQGLSTKHGSSPFHGLVPLLQEAPDDLRNEVECLKATVGWVRRLRQFEPLNFESQQPNIWYCGARQRPNKPFFSMGLD